MAAKEFFLKGQPDLVTHEIRRRPTIIDEFPIGQHET